MVLAQSGQRVMSAVVAQTCSVDAAILMVCEI